MSLCNGLCFALEIGNKKLCVERTKLMLRKRLQAILETEASYNFQFVQ